jgi:hypothetical protein
MSLAISFIKHAYDIRIFEEIIIINLGEFHFEVLLCWQLEPFDIFII